MRWIWEYIYGPIVYLLSCTKFMKGKDTDKFQLYKSVWSTIQTYCGNENHDEPTVDDIFLQ